MANAEMAAKYLASNGAKHELTPRENRERKAPARKRRPRSESFHQAIRQGFLAGIKAERITSALLTEGHVDCARCPRSFTETREALRGLELHHLEKRSHAQGYRRGSWGCDAPRLLELVCRKCHDELESKPMWAAS